MNRLALVTGSARGLGRATALELARRGADLIVCDLTRAAGAASEVVAEARALGRQAIFLDCDVSRGEEVERLARRAEAELGLPQVLVNNAGINVDGLMRTAREADYRKVLSVNLDGPFHCTRIFLPSMRERGWGRIVNVASIVGERGVAGTPYYASSKAGLIGLTKATAVEVARRGVTVNAVAPGWIDTQLIAGYTDEMREKLCSLIPLGRFARAEEVAATIAFLASEEASYITGAVIEVTGGYGL